jgi:hypothetical protein
VARSPTPVGWRGRPEYIEAQGEDELADLTHVEKDDGPGLPGIYVGRLKNRSNVAQSRGRGNQLRISRQVADYLIRR